MELSFQLKTLPPEALDLIRFYGTHDEPAAYSDDIFEAVDMGERTFDKVLRRLITKGYLQMDGDRTYRLTERGQNALAELNEFDNQAGATPVAAPPAATEIQRRLLMIMPRTLIAGQPTPVSIGFEAGQTPRAEANLAVRLAVINGEPSAPAETMFTLTDGPAQEQVQVTAGNFNLARVRVEAYQLGPNPTDVSEAGGMYVDVAVAANNAGINTERVAYGVDVTIKG